MASASFSLSGCRYILSLPTLYRLYIAGSGGFRAAALAAAAAALAAAVSAAASECTFKRSTEVSEGSQCKSPVSRYSNLIRTIQIN